MPGFMDVEDFQVNHGLKQPFLNYPSQNVLASASYETAWGDQATISKMYENLETVYRCIVFIARNLAKVPIKFYKKSYLSGDKTDVTDNPSFDLLTRRPNPFQTLNEFKIETYSRLQLQGEAFWHMDRGESGLGKPTQIYADWLSNEVNIRASSKRMIEKYILFRNGKENEIEPEEVFFMKFFNPYDTIRGLAPLRAARHSIELDLNAVAFNKNFFKQGMKFSGVLSTEQELTEPQASRFKQAFENMYASTTQMHKVAVLWNGMKFDPIQSMNLTDAQFMELRGMNEEKIIMTFGLSAEALGSGGKNATYENVKYYRRLAWTETLQPLMTQFLDVLNQQFLPLLTNDASIKAEADYTNIEALKEDRTQKVKDYQIGLASRAITPNEMRQDVFGKDPFEDPSLDEPLIVTNTQQQTDQTVTNWYKAKGLFCNVKTESARTEIWHQEIKSLGGDITNFDNNMVGYFGEQEARVLKAVDSYVVKKSVKINLTADNLLFDLENEKKILFEKGTPWIFEVYKKAAEQIMRDVRSGKIDYEVPSVRQALGERVLKFSTFVNNTTDKKIKEVVKNIFQENIGENLSDVAAKLKSEISVLYDGFKDTRANSIARTEVVGSRNMGLQEGMVQAKVANKMWITSRDNLVRDYHQIDGQVVPVNGMFKLQNGAEMFYPSDFNERCVMIATNEKVNA